MRVERARAAQNPPTPSGVVACSAFLLARDVPTARKQLRYGMSMAVGSIDDIHKDMGVDYDRMRLVPVGVDPELIRAHGAVSAECAGAMAEGA